MSKENTIVARQASDGTLVEVLPDRTTRPLPDRTVWQIGFYIGNFLV